MAKGSDNDFPSILLTEQAVKPSAPAAGKRRLYFKTDNKLYNEDEGGTETEVGGGAGSDTTAIHDNVSGEIAAITEKTVLHNDDLFVIEDSEDTNAKKRVKKSNLGTGAPSDAEYITSAANGSLSAEVIIPGLAGSADIAGAAGAGISEEYDSATTGLTWNTAPAVEDSDTTIKSHLYVKIAANSEHLGTRAWSPAGAFDARAKFSMGNDSTASNSDSRLYISNADGSLRAMCGPVSDVTKATWYVQAYTYATGSYTKRGVDTIVYSSVVYARITRDGSNNLSFYWSSDGLLWTLIATQALTLTVTKIGYRVSPASTTACYFASDWLRTNV